MLHTWCAFAGLCAWGALSGTTSPLRGSCRRKRRGEPITKDTPCGVCALSGTTSPLWGSCRLRRGEPTSENSGSFSPFLSFGCGSRPIKVQRKKEIQNCISFFLVHFQGLLRPFGARAAFGGANRHPRIAVRSPLLCRSDVVLLRPKYKEKRDAKMHLIFLGALSGTRTLGPLIKSQLLYQLS